MILQDILRTKGAKVLSIEPDATLAEVVQELVKHNVGSLLVCQVDEESRPRMVGIITERDILRAYATHKGAFNEVRVEMVMTANPISASPGDSVEHAMGVMTSKRFRHLPVMSEGRLYGIISIGDVVKSQFDELAMENYYMRSYIQS